MENKKNTSYLAKSISVWDIVSALLSRWFLIILVGIIGGAAMGAYTHYKIEPTYDTYTTLYVFNKAEVGKGEVSNSDLTAAEELANAYKVLLKSKSLKDAIIKEVKANEKYAMLDITRGFLDGAVSVSSVNETQVIKITVTTTDPELSAAIANAYAFVSPIEMTRITEVGKVNVVDYADVPSAPSAPNMTKNCVIGFLIGAFIVAAIIILRLFSDTVLHDSSDIQKTTDLSILGSVPSLKVKGKKETPFTIVKGRNIANEK